MYIINKKRYDNVYNQQKKDMIMYIINKYFFIHFVFLVSFLAEAMATLWDV